MNNGKKLLVMLAVMLLAVGVQAQDNSCSQAIDLALESAGTTCVKIGRDQICYGSGSLQTQVQPSDAVLALSQPGDVANVANIQRLTLHPTTSSDAMWSTAIMQLDANLLDDVPGSTTTLLLFGDVEIENRVEPSSQSAPGTLTVTAVTNTEIFGFPDEFLGTSTEPLAVGQSVVVDGRVEDDGGWVRVKFEESFTPPGWVRIADVTSDDNLMTLPVVDPLGLEAPQGTVFVPEAVPLAPMQIFTFRSGVDDAQCGAALGSGLLIQTPQDDAVALEINGVSLGLSATAFVQAQPGVELTINVLDGVAAVVTEDGAQVIPAGAVVNVPMTDDLNPAGPPSDPQPYDSGSMGSLPTGALPQPVSMAASMNDPFDFARRVAAEGRWMVAIALEVPNQRWVRVARFHLDDANQISGAGRAFIQLDSPCLAGLDTWDWRVGGELRGDDFYIDINEQGPGDFIAGEWDIFQEKPCGLEEVFQDTSETITAFLSSMSLLTVTDFAPTLLQDRFPIPVYASCQASLQPEGFVFIEVYIDLYSPDNDRAIDSVLMGWQRQLQREQQTDRRGRTGAPGC